MFSNDYFLNRLRAGESMDDILNGIVDTANKANQEYSDEVQKKKEEEAKAAELSAAKEHQAREIVDAYLGYVSLAAPDLVEVLGQDPAQWAKDLQRGLDKVLEMGYRTIEITRDDKIRSVFDHFFNLFT